MRGTPFQRSVWEALTRIPEGKVTTYGAIATHLGLKGARAVGTAVGANPDAPNVPCHRVVRADGTLGGYSGPGGAARKAELLEAEGIAIAQGRVVGMEAVLFDTF